MGSLPQPPAGQDAVRWAGITVIMCLVMFSLTVLIGGPIEACRQVQSCVVAYDLDSANSQLSSGLARPKRLYLKAFKSI